MTPLEALRKVWGYPAFRGPQERVIETAMSGRDALVVMPTGGGKSLCYQVPRVIGAKVGTPLGDAVRLVDREQ
ncbi:DEAD/DEAH box helicase, partial [bacterium]